ncbi:hypothetical protein NE237_001857 [Protea cynaroides]|uniref:Uncharacterized protein n=1 Tax=Protea cynaroides TaxID=273540 RepID=A0A9Q0KU52_9MAGN|nr:hypothetical protein NE237_001857 [Protea cynaroides]
MSLLGWDLQGRGSVAKFIMIFKLKLVFKQKNWNGILAWVNNCSKKNFRSLFWRVKAATKAAINGGAKKELTFQYDPSSYALNFDDGHSNLREEINEFKQKHVGDSAANRNYTWVYVLWVKAY